MSTSLGNVPFLDFVFDDPREDDAAKAMEQASQDFGVRRPEVAGQHQRALGNQLGALSGMNNMAESMFGGGINFAPSVYNYPTLPMAQPGQETDFWSDTMEALSYDNPEARRGYLRRQGMDGYDVSKGTTDYADDHWGWDPGYDAWKAKAAQQSGKPLASGDPYPIAGQGPRFR